jgi:hypothetical protein
MMVNEVNPNGSSLVHAINQSVMPIVLNLDMNERTPSIIEDDFMTVHQEEIASVPAEISSIATEETVSGEALMSQVVKIPFTLTAEHLFCGMKDRSLSKFECLR